MRLSVYNGVKLYMRIRRQCDDIFSMEKIPFCLNHPRDPAAGLKSQKC
jgi:hypothetical protein